VTVALSARRDSSPRPDSGGLPAQDAHVSRDLRFDAPRDLAVYVCAHAGRGGSPVLQVVHDEDGDWQFLCGGDHGDGDEPMLVCLGEIVDRDPSVNEVAAMCVAHTATRAARGAPWQIVDDMEEKIRHNVREHGWQVSLIPEHQGEPPFAYSIGLDPELIVFGLRHEVMQSMINELGKRIRAGLRAAAGDRVDGLLVDATCVLVEVDPSRYRPYFGYGLWYHQGPSFRALQIVWPSKTTGKLPWDDDVDAWLRARQPVLTATRAG
jgi:hypothetical protein